MKQCRKCGEMKPLSEFYKNRNAKDGLTLYLVKFYKNAEEENRQLVLAEDILKSFDVPLAINGIRRAIQNNRWYMSKLLAKMTEEQIISLGYKRTSDNCG